MRNWQQTVISQFNNSAKLTALLESIDEWISPDADLESFYTLIWNIDTAQGYGLDVWGRIVNVSRILQDAGGSYFDFGFGEAGDRTGFAQSPFYTGQPLTSNYRLPDDLYRRLIFAKAALNLTDSAIPAINKIMMDLFPNRGNAYVTDGRNGPTGLYFGFAEAQDRVGFTLEIGRGLYFGFGEAGDRLRFDQPPFIDLVEEFALTNDAPFCDSFVPGLPGNMTMIYVFDFVLAPFEIAIVTQSGVLPKPVGVRARAQYI